MPSLKEMWDFLQDFHRNRRGATKGIAGSVIGIFIGAIMFGAMMPTAITQIEGANTTGWGTAVIAIWGVMSIIIIVVSLMSFVSQIKS